MCGHLLLRLTLANSRRGSIAGHIKYAFLGIVVASVGTGYSFLLISPEVHLERIDSEWTARKEGDRKSLFTV